MLEKIINTDSPSCLHVDSKNRITIHLTIPIKKYRETMNPNTARDLFGQIKSFIISNPSIEQAIPYGTLLARMAHVSCDLSTVYTQMPPNVFEDHGSRYLLPTPYRHGICGQSTADGSCLYNSVSIALIGNESLAIELRIATIAELLGHIEYYLQLPVFQSDVAYSNTALDEGNQSNTRYPKIKKYLKELAENCSICAYSPLLAVYGLTGVLRRPINSIFPSVGGNFRAAYNQIIRPRQENHYNPPIAILWTRVGVQSKSEALAYLNSFDYSTNHFVPVFFPESTITTAAMIDIDDNDNDVDDVTDDTVPSYNNKTPVLIVID